MRKDIETQISEMEEMKLPELQARFAEVVGEETKAPNKKYLIKRIVAALEQEAEQVDGAEEQDDNQPIEPENEMSEEDDEPSHDDEENDEYVDDEIKGESEEDKSPETETETETNDNLPRKERSLSKLDVDELRDLYVETIGRPTGSMDKRYLIWKITQARKGKITVGPIPNRQRDGVSRDYRVLPLRMETELVDKLDEAWKRHGLSSRMELFRKSLADYMSRVGEDDLAEMLVS